MNLSILFGHGKQLVEAAMLLHGAALIIVNLTPTPKDNEALSSTGSMVVKLYRAIEVMAGVITPLVKR